MTFQDAQARFSKIVATVTPASTAAEAVQAQGLLLALQNSLPNTEEFDSIADAIAATAPQLMGQLTQTVLDDLRTRTQALSAATGLLDQTAAAAKADARVLTFAQPKLIAAGLTGSIAAVRDLRIALSGDDVAAASAKSEALLTQLTQLLATIKTN